MNEGGCNEETNSADYELAFIVYNTCCNTGYGTEAICLFQRRVGGFKADQSKKTKSGVRTFIYDEEAAESGKVSVWQKQKAIFRIRVRTEQPVFLF